jgi:hypothetical protein
MLPGPVTLREPPSADHDYNPSIALRHSISSVMSPDALASRRTPGLDFVGGAPRATVVYRGSIDDRRA